MEIWAKVLIKLKLKDNETEKQAEIRINQIMNNRLSSDEENQIQFNVHKIKLHDELEEKNNTEKETKTGKKKDWYRCTTREEMALLVQAGFDYINFREDKYNNGNITYYFEKNKQLEEFISVLENKSYE